MNVGNPRHKNTSLHVEAQTRQEADAPIAAALAAFGQNKESLIANLRDLYDGGTKPKPFDGNKLWSDLTSIAKLYFWGKHARKETMPSSVRVKLLRQLAKALGKAHELTEEAMEGDVRSDLFRAWLAGTKPGNMPQVLSNYYEVDLLQLDIKKAVSGLADLEAAADRAAKGIPDGSPGPTAAFPRDCVGGLKRVYQDSTGMKPGAGDGPFARFVFEFVTALGHKIEYGSIVDAIKDALHELRSLPPLTAGEAPSAGDE